jgi:NADH-quinone oxidoreductase subunit J
VTTVQIAAVAGEAPLGEQLAFWVLGSLALLGAAGLVFAKNAVHCALWLVITMLSVGCMYLTQGAQFLGFAQIIVYTGAIMMLFLFVLMLTGRESHDALVETLRGQRTAGLLVGIGVVALVVFGLIRGLGGVAPAGLEGALAERGEMGSIAQRLFTDFLFPFELTSALLITAALGAMVLAHVEKRPGEKRSQRQMVADRMRSGRMSPLPGPGVFATSSSNATPALLPDGSIAPESVSTLVEQSVSEQVARAHRESRNMAPLEGRDHPRTVVGELPVGSTGPVDLENASTASPHDAPDGRSTGSRGLEGWGASE